MNKSKKYRIKQKDFMELEKLADRIYIVDKAIDYLLQNAIK